MIYTHDQILNAFGALNARFEVFDPSTHPRIINDGVTDHVLYTDISGSMWTIEADIIAKTTMDGFAGHYQYFDHAQPYEPKYKITLNPPAENLPRVDPPSRGGAGGGRGPFAGGESRTWVQFVGRIRRDGTFEPCMIVAGEEGSE